MILDEKGVRTLLGFEGMVLTVYLDAAGIATTCGGHVVLKEDRAWIYDADGITRADCERVLARDVMRFVRAVEQSARVPVSQPMVNAMVSLAYNIGEDAFARSSVVRLLNEGKYSEAADAFLLWRFVRVKQRDGTYAKKPILLGRRQAEAALFRAGILEVMGARYSEPPTWEQLAAIAESHQFGLFELLPSRPAIETEQEDCDERDGDGRLVCLPPDNEEPQTSAKEG